MLPGVLTCSQAGEGRLPATDGPPQGPPHLSSPLSELCSFHLCSNTTVSVISRTTSLKMAEPPLGFSHSLLHFTTFEVMLFVMFIILFLQEEYTCLRAGIFLCVAAAPKVVHSTEKATKCVLNK